jgi:hypothetical protein
MLGLFFLNTGTDSYYQVWTDERNNSSRFRGYVLGDKSPTKCSCKSLKGLWAQNSLFLLGLFFLNICTGTYKRTNVQMCKRSN